MADAATTGTLVLVALSGGTGAFLGVVVNQVVQLGRDKKQNEREDIRREQERQHELDDARLQRREDRYVAALDALVSVGPPLATAQAALSLWARWHEQVFRQDEDDDTAWLWGSAGEPLDVTVGRVQNAQRRFDTAQGEAVLAVLRTFSVASGEAQRLGEQWITSVVVWPDWLMPRPLRPGEGEARRKDFPLAPVATYVTEMVQRLRDLDDASGALTRALRGELRLA